MFKKFLTYYRYQKSIRQWAATVGYTEKDIDWIFTWTNITTAKPHKNLVVVFERDLRIRDYTTIYKTAKLTILEKNPADMRKVRFGVPPELLQELLTYVRLVAAAQVAQSPLPDATATVRKEFQPYLKDSFTVDVGVWVDGNLRGSRLVNSDNNDNAVTTATVNCLNDDRLKPIMSTELDRAIFEITIVPNLWFPVDESNLQQPASHTMATHCTQAGSIKSIYVPMIANQTAHGNLSEYLGGLYQKAKLVEPKGVTFETAPAYPAVETGKGEILILEGCHPKYITTEISAHSLEIIRDNILVNIDDDGFVPIIRTVKNEANAALDLTRIAFVFYALSEYWALTNDQRVETKLEALQKMLGHILDHHAKNPQTMWAKNYCNQAAAYVPHLIRPQPFTVEETSYVKQTPLGHIQYTKQQILQRGIGAEAATRYLATVREIFQAWRESPPQFKCPVQYADLLWLLVYSNLPSEAEEFANWLRTIQNEDGSFHSQVPAKVYSRGTGKVAEAAACCADTEDITKKALTYLRKMQYSDATMYHIPMRLQGYYRGGFRHDAWNRDLWLDGSAHVLLAELRLLHASAYRDHLQTYLSEYRLGLSQ